MLASLSIRDMLLIEQVDLRFATGLNVLTGETGAGKSILLDSLGFVLGRRGRATLVRQGADLGEVTAEFELEATHPVGKILEEAGFPFDGHLILRRHKLSGWPQARLCERSPVLGRGIAQSRHGSG